VDDVPEGGGFDEKDVGHGAVRTYSLGIERIPQRFVKPAPPKAAFAAPS
jgi:hypothetical protein